MVVTAGESAGYRAVAPGLACEHVGFFAPADSSEDALDFVVDLFHGVGGGVEGVVSLLEAGDGGGGLDDEATTFDEVYGAIVDAAAGETDDAAEGGDLR
jgi:hypothetical protein